MPVIAGTTSTGHIILEPGVEMHEGAVEERIALAEHHDILARPGQIAQAARDLGVERRQAGGIARIGQAEFRS